MCIFGMTKSRFFGGFAKHDFFMFYIFNMVLLFPNNDLKLNPYQQNWTHIRNIENKVDVAISNLSPSENGLRSGQNDFFMYIIGMPSEH